MRYKITNFFYSCFLLSLFFSLVSCGDDDDDDRVLADQNNRTEEGRNGNVDEKTNDIDVLGKWKIKEIDKIAWQTLSYNESEGYIVFEKDSTYTTRKGGFHLLDIQGTTHFTVQGTDVFLYNQGKQVATFSFSKIENNTAQVSLKTSERTMLCVFEKQAATSLNYYEAKLIAPKGLRGGGDLYLGNPSSQDAFQFNYFQIKKEETKFYFRTGKSGTLYLRLSGLYELESGEKDLFELDGSQPQYYSWVKPYHTFALKEGTSTINIADGVQCKLTLKVVETEDFFDAEDELTYPHSERNQLYRVTCTTPNYTGIGFSVVSLANDNPCAIDWAISSSCSVRTRTTNSSTGRQIGELSTYVEAKDGYEADLAYSGAPNGVVSVKKIAAPINYTLEDVKGSRSTFQPDEGKTDDKDTDKPVDPQPNDPYTAYSVRVTLTANASNIEGCTFKYYLGTQEAKAGNADSWLIYKTTTLKISTYVGSTLKGTTNTTIEATDGFSTEVNSMTKIGICKQAMLLCME